MPKIFVQGEVRAARGTRRDAAHTVEMGDAHGDAIACVLICEGVGEPGFGCKVACDTMHELVEWTENNASKIIKEADFELDYLRFIAGISACIALVQMRWGEEDSGLPIHFAFLIAYKGEYLVVRVGEAKVLLMGADGCFEVGVDPTAEHIALTQTALVIEPEPSMVSGTNYEFHIGEYKEGDLFLAMTPGIWDCLGEDGLERAYADHKDLDEASLNELTADLICETGKAGGSAGLSLAGVEMMSFTPYQTLGIKVS